MSIAPPRYRPIVEHGFALNAEPDEKVQFGKRQPNKRQGRRGGRLAPPAATLRSVFNDQAAAADLFRRLGSPRRRAFDVAIAAAAIARARMLRELNGVVSHSAIVHEAEGFRAAMIRSIVTGVAALSNPGFPHRVFTQVPEAAAWMADERVSPFLIASTVAEVRAVTSPASGAQQPASSRMTRRSS